MDLNKSPDPYLRIFVALLHDVQTLHSGVFTDKALRQTIQKVESRCAQEGISFLAKTLPRFGKALDRALTGETTIDASELGFEPQTDSKLPKLFGELLNCVFSHDGRLKPTPCVQSIKTLRQVLYLFYKLELPYETSQEQQVIEKFTKTDQELEGWNSLFSNIAEHLDASVASYDRVKPANMSRTIRLARRLLAKLFSKFDPSDISPRHGPGAVSTKETLWEKYQWTKISPRILQTYPLDAYFYASLGHVCDELHRDSSIELGESSAKVCLVPKDSRGPRLISCEPLDFQYVQQGLGRAIVQHVERHPLTRWSVHFTDQTPNQCAASLGSIDGSYATLDLNEASDRVSIGLVRLLFPEPLLSALMNCRSQSTTLPGGEVLKLNKYAPMGSCLCFPVLALTVWAILTAGLSDAVSDGQCMSCKKHTLRGHAPCDRCIDERILVYGDDVVVPTAQAANAITLLESFGLLVNRDKSCVSGFFRESCGRDVFSGVNVTPVRIRTVWHHYRCPDTYTSYIAYANECYRRNYYNVYQTLVEGLFRTYGPIPEESMELPCPSLVSVPVAYRLLRSRVNPRYQRVEWLVTTVKAPKVARAIGGWSMLLRHFVESPDPVPLGPWASQNASHADAAFRTPITSSEAWEPFTVRTYTKRKTSCLVRKWVARVSVATKTVSMPYFRARLATSWDTVMDASPCHRDDEAAKPYHQGGSAEMQVTVKR